MLRELIDPVVLDDFVAGLARAAETRVLVFDSQGRLVSASPARSPFAILTRHSVAELPIPLHLVTMPADEPPLQAAFVSSGGIWNTVVPLHVDEQLAGFVSAGECRDGHQPPPEPPANLPPEGAAAWLRAWQGLPELSRSSDAALLTTARWAARMLARWCRREAELNTTSEQLSLISDIGEMLSGEQSLQAALDRIATITARAMKCRFASLRLYDAQAEELRIAAVYGLSTDYVSKGRVLRAENPIDDAALRGALVYIENAQSDPRVRFPEAARRLGVVSGLTAGMIYRGTPVGVLRVYSDHKRKFLTVYRHILRTLASQAAIAVVNARLADERLRGAELRRELELAAQVQTRMIPARAPEHPAVESAVIFEPSSHVGGDFCELLTLRDGSLLAAIGDVTGHGVPASLLMASLRGALRAGLEFASNLGELFTRLNEHVYRDTSSREFVTLAALAIARDGRSMRYCNAGHEPPVLVRGGRVRTIDDGGLLMGMQPGEVYEQAEMKLEPGDFLAMYTDGAAEAMNFESRVFGRARLLETFREWSGEAPASALANVRWEILRYVGLADQSDDLTMLALRIR